MEHHHIASDEKVRTHHLARFHDAGIYASFQLLGTYGAVAVDIQTA
eukprot:CAMPEP_0172837244 /NCGR_PEP_ID=MMETSP1075-20121228/27055_1 /TAXON_ID=2916 /ORGANISM="Ceratium fusus, Strain PA161109" /LENGTH=45 /DNA_ID= /DNA_START= /DNA_END= /DNA_ORIENTATION=